MRRRYAPRVKDDAFPRFGKVISIQEPMGTALIRDDERHQVWGVARKYLTPEAWAVISIGALVDFRDNGYGSAIDAKRHA